jgi:hypothetical protein
MTCPDYLVPCAERNSHTAELRAKVWPADATAGMLGPEAVGRGGPSVIRFRCPKCRSDLEFGDSAAGRVVRCPDCPARLRVPGELTGDPPRRRKKRRRSEAEDSTELSETTGWIAPAIILGIGLVLSVGTRAMTGGTEGFAAGVGVVALRLVAAVPLSIAGMFIAAPLLGITFGTIGRAILRLAAINVLDVAIQLYMEAAGVGMLGFAITGPMNFLLFKWLFQLDFYETMFSVTVIGLIQFLALLTVTAAALRHAKWGP